jgi:hypothetical protein
VKGSRATRVLPRALAVGCLVTLTLAQTARADEAAGSAALARARAAWDRHALKAAEGHYRDAVAKGGLAPDEVLEGYVRLGAIRASLGKKKAAVAAFRAASILDAEFEVPKEAGKKGAALAEQARRDMAKIGSLQISIEAPKEAEAGKPFTVRAQIDAAHVPILTKVGLVVRDGTNGKESTQEAPPEETVEFEVSGNVVLPSASLFVRVDALDAQDNRLGSAESRVIVPDEPAAVASGGSAAPRWVSAGPPAKDERRDTKARGGSFWSSPWPYLIGSVALAGAGAAVYFGTRPPADVSVGAVGVQTR